MKYLYKLIIFIVSCLIVKQTDSMEIQCYTIKCYQYIDISVNDRYKYTFKKYF